MSDLPKVELNVECYKINNGLNIKIAENFFADKTFISEDFISDVGEASNPTEQKESLMTSMSQEPGPFYRAFKNALNNRDDSSL